MFDSGEESALSSKPTLYSGTACDQCFRCKVRCKGNRPTCSRCSLNTSPCTYSTGKPASQSRKSKTQNSKRSCPIQAPVSSPMPSCQRVSSSSDSVSTSASKREYDDTEMELALAERMNVGDSVASESNPSKPSRSIPRRLESFPSKVLLISNPPLDLFGKPWKAADRVYSEHNSIPLEPERLSDFISPLEVDFDIEVGEFEFSQDSLPLECSALQMSDVNKFLPFPLLSQPITRDTTVSPTLRLCDPTSVETIARLYDCQFPSSQISIDTTLMIARQGVDLVMHCFPRSTGCLTQAHGSTSASSMSMTALASVCIQIMQQVSVCYENLRRRFAHLGDKSIDHSISIGDFKMRGIEAEVAPFGYQIEDDSIQLGKFQIQGAENCRSVLDVILTKEIKTFKRILDDLDIWSKELGLCGNESNDILIPFIRNLQARLTLETG